MEANLVTADYLSGKRNPVSQPLAGHNTPAPPLPSTQRDAPWAGIIQERLWGPAQTTRVNGPPHTHTHTRTHTWINDKDTDGENLKMKIPIYSQRQKSCPSAWALYLRSIPRPSWPFCTCTLPYVPSEREGCYITRILGLNGKFTGHNCLRSNTVANLLLRAFTSELTKPRLG